MKTTHPKSRDAKIKEPTREGRDDPAQSERFIEAAIALGAAEDEKEAERAFKKVIPAPANRSKKSV